MIPNGSIVTYVGHWPFPSLFSFTYLADTYVSDVLAAFASNGLISKRIQTNATPLGGIPLTGLDVQIDFQIQNGMGFDSVTDIINLVRGGVQYVAGQSPTSDSVPVVQVPGGAPVPTGQPGAISTGPCTFHNLTSGNCSFSDWIGDLTQKGIWSLSLIALGLFAAFVLIGAGPREIAGRVAR